MMDFISIKSHGLFTPVLGLISFSIEYLVLISIVGPLVAAILWYMVRYITSPLRKYPGPRLAALTNFWRMYQAYRGSMHVVVKRLHDKHGPVVRVAPNQLDLDCPSLIKTCLDRGGVWKLTEFHSIGSPLFDGKVRYNLFTEVDNENYNRIKRPVAKHYSMSSVLLFQSHVDDVLASFTRKLNTEFVNKGEVMGEVIDFSQWATFLVADMIGKVTCGQPLGYIDRGCDFDGVLEANDKLMLYFSVVGMNPVLDKFLDKNTVYPIGVSSFRNFTRVALQLIERYKGEDKRDPLRPDFMDRFIESKVACPDVIDDVQILSYIAGQYVAGVDSTAAALRSIFYLSLKNPSVWGRLQAEILAAPFAQEDSMNLPAPFAEARAIPYLEAVIREAVRLYPGSCFPIERYVPAGGLTLPDGSFVPEGVAVGFNAYIVNRNKEIFGLDADVFRPERWLRDDENGEAEEDYKLRLTKMNNYDLSFSAGSRKCIGMNLGLMLLYKTAATLVALYEFELADPGKEWEIRSFVFPKQSGINVRMRQRGEMTIRKELGMPKPTGY